MFCPECSKKIQTEWLWCAYCQADIHQLTLPVLLEKAIKDTMLYDNMDALMTDFLADCPYNNAAQNICKVWFMREPMAFEIVKERLLEGQKRNAWLVHMGTRVYQVLSAASEEEAIAHAAREHCKPSAYKMGDAGTPGALHSYHPFIVIDEAGHAQLEEE